MKKLVDKLKLRVELVPSNCWWSNVRSNLTKQDWDKIRKKIYREANNLCEICGEKGAEHPVECHEIWNYNLTNTTQELNGFIALCPSCHQVKHIGLANKLGKFNEALRHFMKINEITDHSIAMEFVTYFFEEHKEISSINWNFDISLLARNFDIKIENTKFKNDNRIYYSAKSTDKKLLIEKINRLIEKSDSIFQVEEDIDSVKPESILMLIYLRKRFLASKSGSDFKLGHDYYEFTNEKEELINIRESKTMNFDVFIKGLTYEIHTDKKCQTSYIKGSKNDKEFEIFRRGGNIITHNFETGIYYNQSKQYEVNEKFKKKSR
jgi:hypothetical protein